MKIKCTLHSKPDTWAEGGIGFRVFNNDDMSSFGYTALQTVEVEFNDIPREVLVSGAIAAYREEQKRIRAEAQSKVARLDEAIQSLLCLEHKP